jgi:Rrf2 family protein
VRCLLYLSSKGVGVLCNRRQIAAAMGIPDPFLGKIAQQLARAGYIEIIQGAKGGLKMVVSPQKLTLLDVVETMTGENYLNDCISRPGSYNRSTSCAVHRVWYKARTQLRETLREATFADLIKEDRCLSPCGQVESKQSIC